MNVTYKQCIHFILNFIEKKLCENDFNPHHLIKLLLGKTHYKVRYHSSEH